MRVVVQRHPRVLGVALQVDDLHLLLPHLSDGERTLAASVMVAYTYIAAKLLTRRLRKVHHYNRLRFPEVVHVM